MLQTLFPWHKVFNVKIHDNHVLSLRSMKTQSGYRTSLKFDRYRYCQTQFIILSSIGTKGCKVKLAKFGVQLGQTWFRHHGMVWIKSSSEISYDVNWSQVIANIKRKTFQSTVEAKYVMQAKSAHWLQLPWIVA